MIQIGPVVPFVSLAIFQLIKFSFNLFVPLFVVILQGGYHIDDYHTLPEDHGQTFVQVHCNAH